MRARVLDIEEERSNRDLSGNVSESRGVFDIEIFSTRVVDIFMHQEKEFDHDALSINLTRDHHQQLSMKEHVAVLKRVALSDLPSL